MSNEALLTELQDELPLAVKALKSRQDSFKSLPTYAGEKGDLLVSFVVEGETEKRVHPVKRVNDAIAAIMVEATNLSGKMVINSALYLLAGNDKVSGITATKGVFTVTSLDGELVATFTKAELLSQINAIRESQLLEVSAHLPLRVSDGLYKTANGSKSKTTRQKVESVY